MGQSFLAFGLQGKYLLHHCHYKGVSHEWTGVGSANICPRRVMPAQVIAQAEKKVMAPVYYLDTREWSSSVTCHRSGKSLSRSCLSCSRKPKFGPLSWFSQTPTMARKLKECIETKAQSLKDQITKPFSQSSTVNNQYLEM